MPPKKKEEPVEKPVLGRFKSNLKVQTVDVTLVLRVWTVFLSTIWPVQNRGYQGYCNCDACDCVQMGIVGLPNVGKSTLFNTLGKVSIPAENFPFCTIEPNNVSDILCKALHARSKWMHDTFCSSN